VEFENGGIEGGMSERRLQGRKSEAGRTFAFTTTAKVATRLGRRNESCVCLYQESKRTSGLGAEVEM
jgi:hypothetical protein